MKVGLVLGPGGCWAARGSPAPSTPSPRDRLGPRQRRLHRRHLGRLGDRGARRGGRAALVHGRPLGGESFDGLTGPTDAPPRRPTARPARCSGPPRPAGARARARCGWPLSALRPAPAHAAPAVAGWLPAGLMSTDSSEHVRRAVPDRWVDHPTSGRSPATTAPAGAPFGRADAAARRPSPTRSPRRARSPASTGRSIGGRRYVDGGVCSASNLDLLAGAASTS